MKTSKQGLNFLNRVVDFCNAFQYECDIEQRACDNGDEGYAITITKNGAQVATILTSIDAWAIGAAYGRLLDIVIENH